MIEQAKMTILETLWDSAGMGKEFTVPDEMNEDWGFMVYLKYLSDILYLETHGKNPEARNVKNMLLSQIIHFAAEPKYEPIGLGE